MGAETPARPLCRHCNRHLMTRARGLCFYCSRKPGVRDMYPTTSKYARRGVPNCTGDRPLPEPTTAAPGTPEKLAELERRAAAMLALHHPEDATCLPG